MPKPLPSPSTDSLVAQLPTALQPLARRGVARAYRKGATIIEEGTQGDTIYILLRGRVKVCSADHRGREIVYGVYGPGEYVGEMSLDGGLRSASVESLESSSLVMVTRQSLLDHIAQHPEFAFDLLAKVIRRARAATLSTRQLALNDVYGRLKALLESASVDTGTGTRTIREHMTHRDMASRLGCSREMVSRLLKDLVEGHYLIEAPGGLVLPGPLPPRW